MAAAMSGSGVSIEQQEQAWRVAELRKVPAAVRFISAEPLLGPLDLDLGGIDWLIAGGESGPNHRPMDERWALELRDQCAPRLASPFSSSSGRGPARQDRWPCLSQGRTWHDMPTAIVGTDSAASVLPDWQSSGVPWDLGHRSQ